MHRIDTKGNQNGRFTNGDSTGPEIKPATVLDADWCNGVQEEICGVIEKAGLSLEKGQTQLVKAIERLGFDRICENKTQLEAALAEQKEGIRIKIVRSMEVGPMEITAANVCIECAWGVELRGSSESLFHVKADGFCLKGASIFGFKNAMEFQAPDVTQKASLLNCFITHPQASFTGGAEPQGFINTSGRIRS